MTIKNGKPCKKCGTSDWYDGGGCKECSRIRYKNNREKLITYAREWKRANRKRAYEINRKSLKKYRERNKNSDTSSYASAGYYREYYRKNKEKIKEINNRSRIKNKEKHKERKNRYMKKWRSMNKEKVSAFNKKYAKNNKEKIRANEHKKRARRRNCKGSYTVEEWETLLDLCDNKCLCCGQSGTNLTVDHIVPLSKGGDNNIENIQPLCRTCNNKKYTKETDYRTDEIKRAMCTKLWTI